MSGTTWSGLAVSAVPMGLAFGMAMQNGLVILPETIRMQFTFSRFIMLKMFLSASIASCVSFAALSVMAPKAFKKARDAFFGCGSEKSMLGTTVGAGMLGAGMAIGGACPGMVIVQMGCGVPNCYYTFAGGLAGAATYGVFEGQIRPLLKGPVMKRELDDYFPGVSFATLALGLASMMAAVTGIIEYFAPWTSDLPVFATPWKSAWPPELSGAIIGSLQVPAVMLLSDTLGSSSAYMTTLAQLLMVPSLEKGFTHIAGFKDGPGNWWQVIYLVASASGSYISSQAMGTYGAAQGLSPALGFIGGFFMLFGSRVASGCTSGHGLSGMALLSVPSIAAVCGMFGTAIVCGLTYSAIGGYSVYQ